MHILVCIKEIPDPDLAAALFRVDEDAKKVTPISGLRSVISPFDEQAIEAALRIREALGTAKITLLSMGPESARGIAKHGLSLGADEAVLLIDEAFEEADSYTTALTLATAIRKIGEVDLILTGRQAADWDAGVVGCGIAEFLGLPAITFAGALEVEEGMVRVERALSDGVETVEASLPAVVTVSHELGEPRSASLRETMRAARKPVTVWTADDLSLASSQVGGRGARRVLERLYIPANDMVCEFIEGDTPEAMATALARRLCEEQII
jgi:electron transfer flavoprotein beta subunit